LVFEFLGAFILVLTVVHVTVKGVPETGSALAIAAALAVGVVIAAERPDGREEDRWAPVRLDRPGSWR
jgi:glycerol uptake facilitator-like aquaporin